MQSINVVPGIPTPASCYRGLICEQDPAVAQANYLLSGTTRDSTGAALAGCTYHLFQTLDDSEAAQNISDGSGLFNIYVTVGVQYYIVAYLSGSPDVAGTTVNTLTGTQV